MIRFILKLWPALLPIIIYLIWFLLIDKIIKKLRKKKDYIDADYQLVGKKEVMGRFSLKNPRFVKILYVTLVLMILCLIYSAINARNLALNNPPKIHIISE